MTRTKAAITVAAVVAIAGATSMFVRHRGDASSTQRTRAELVAPRVSDATIAKALHEANVRVDDLTATNVGGIVVLKGAGDAASADQAASVVHQLGFTRVANLIQRRSVPDDENIRREAERQLASTRALDGCTLRVSCTNGIVRVEGTAQSDIQSDVARNVLRGIGAHGVEVALTKKL
jgi:osmotically-inducible protein OsmY